MVSDCIGKGKVIIPRCCNITIFDKGVMKMPVEGFFYGHNIFHRSNSSNTDLFSSVDVLLWGSHSEIYKSVALPDTAEIQTEMKHTDNKPLHTELRRCHWAEGFALPKGSSTTHTTTLAFKDAWSKVQGVKKK